MIIYILFLELVQNAIVISVMTASFSMVLCGCSMYDLILRCHYDTRYSKTPDLEE
jgi:hypothetical protein